MDLWNTESLCIIHLFQQDLCTTALLPIVITRRANIAFDNVVAEHDTDRFIIGEMLNQRQSIRNAALAFLVSIVQMPQTKILSISKQPQKLARRIAARYDHYVVDAGIDQRLYRIIDHRLVVNR